MHTGNETWDPKIWLYTVIVLSFPLVIGSLSSSTANQRAGQNNGIRSAAKGGVDRCPARAAAAVSAADPTFRPE